jgi:sterol desaturase/sphingolipid hydroxylase (fatty acid hydroxylase superfamily)
MSSTLPIWLGPAVLGGAILALVLAEALSPLRRRTQPRLRRWLRNLGTALIAFAAARPLQLLLLIPFAAWLQELKLGLLHLVDLPALPELVLALLMLDATLWYWHWANHRVGLLWRFHAVHHEDKDVDASTALRFHFGELSLSVAWRALQVVIVGAAPAHLAVYTLVLTISALFHHANLRLPFAVERVLVQLVVTPRMHGIHHSTVLRETDSNYSSILSIWDRLHRTLRLDRPQDEITIGLPGSESGTAAAGLWRLQLQPFTAQPSPGECGVEPRDDEAGTHARLAP